MAYDIFQLTSVQRIADGSSLPLRAHPNSSARLPEPVCMLIWDEPYDKTGHVAIITEVSSSYVRLIEQNYDDLEWPSGQGYARELGASLDPDGRYTIHDKWPILGW